MVVFSNASLYERLAFMGAGWLGEKVVIDE